jgi:hypothetical protein
VQLRYATKLTSEEYVTQKAWQKATLDRCPRHPEGGCGFERHGTYERKKPAGALIARWYCPTDNVTFSLLPDCLAARLSGSLQEVEAVVATAERAPSLEAAADMLRPDIELQGGVRWVRRRVRLVHAALATLLGLLFTELAGYEPTVWSFRSALKTEWVLPVLRERAQEHLARLPFPLGFGPRPITRWRRAGARQHFTGADPPRGLR